MNSINSLNPPLNHINTSNLDQQNKESAQAVRNCFDHLQKPLKVLKGNLKKDQVEMFLKREMNRIHAMVYPPFRIYKNSPLFRHALFPFCHPGDILSMASTCKNYYSVVHNSQFWAAKVKREIPYPVFPIPINELYPMTCKRFYLHKRAFSNLPKMITQSRPQFSFDYTTLHTTNTIGEIVILKKNKEIYLLRNNIQHQLPDFPTPTSKYLTEEYLPMKKTNTITHVGMQKEGRLKNGTGSMFFTVVQWDYIQATIVNGFTYVISDTPKCLLDKNVNARWEQGGNSTIICKLSRENIRCELIINLMSKTINPVTQSHFLKTYLQNSNSYIEHNYMSNCYTLHRENLSPLSLSLEGIACEGTCTALSPDETHFAVLRCRNAKYGQYNFMLWDLILWDLNHGTQQNIMEIIPPRHFSRSIRNDELCFKFLSQHVLAIGIQGAWEILRLGPSLERSSLNLKQRPGHPVIDVTTDPCGLLITESFGKKAYYPLVP